MDGSRQAVGCSCPQICISYVPWLMQGKAQPQQLMRVGSTLYRRAMSFTVTSPKPLSVIRGIEEDGTAQLSSLAAGCALEEVSAGLIVGTPYCSPL